MHDEAKSSMIAVVLVGLRRRLRGVSYFHGWKLVSLIVVLVLCLATVLPAFVLWRQSASPMSELFVPPRLCRLGHVWEQPEFSWTLPMHNASMETVEVVSVVGSCSCVSVSPKRFFLPGGGIVDVKLSLDLRWRGDASKTPESCWPLKVQVAAVTRCDPPTNHAWTLTGMVWRSPLVLRPKEVDFGDSLVHGCEFSPKCVRLESVLPLTDLRVWCDPSIATVTVDDAESVEPVSAYQLKILPRSDLPVGQHKFVVHIHTRMADRDLPAGIHESPQYDLPVQATVVQSSYVVPASLVLGVCEVGNTVEESVVVGLRGRARDFTVRGEIGKSGSIKVEPSQIDPITADAKVFKVTQSVDQVGPCSESVRFEVEVQGEETQVITLPVSYFGVVD